MKHLTFEDYINAAIVEVQEQAKHMPMELTSHILTSLYNAEASFIQKKVVKEE